MAASRLADEPVSSVLDLTSPALSSELGNLEARLDVVHGLLNALGRINEVNKVIQFTHDRFSALVAMQNEPLGYSRQQAEAILDMPMSWQCSDKAERLRAERDDLSARRAALAERVTEVLTLHWFG